MIEALDTIESSGHPLAFPIAIGQPAPLRGDRSGAAVFKVEARAMGGHQKEAVITEGVGGSSWRVVSDEGPILGGSDLAPAPLSFFCAGLQADLMGRIHALAPAHAVRIDELAAAVENQFAFTGSFARGTGEGSTQPANIAIAVRTGAPQEDVVRLVREAIDSSPAVASLRRPLASTFALYANGKRSAVQGVQASDAADAIDPFVSHRRRPAPVPGAATDALITRLLGSQAQAGPLPASGGSANVVVAAQAVAREPQAPLRARTRLSKPAGSSFDITSDERGFGARAPSGLALLAAGISFCYLTQLLRYVQHRRYDVRAIRLVQYSPFALERSTASHALHGLAGPVDTHLFLHGQAPAEVMQELLFYSARTCFLHAALASPFEPHVTLSLNGGDSLPIDLSHRANN